MTAYITGTIMHVPVIGVYNIDTLVLIIYITGTIMHVPVIGMYHTGAIILATYIILQQAPTEL